MKKRISDIFPRPGIQGKLTFIFVLLSSVPLILLSIYTVQQQIDVKQSENIRDMKSEIKGLKSRTTLFLTKIESEITLVMKSTELRKLLSNLEANTPISSESQSNAEKEFLNIVTDNNFYLKASLLNRRGKEILSVLNDNREASIVPKELLSKSPKNYYTHAVSEMNPGEIFLSPAEIKSPSTGNFLPIVDFILPIYNKSDQVIAIVTINIRAENLFELLVPADNTPSKKIFIVNGEGFYIFHSEKKNNWNALFTNRSDENIFRDYSKEIALDILSDRPDTTLYHQGRIIQYSSIFSGSKARTDKYFIVEDVSAKVVMPSLEKLKTLFIVLIISVGIFSLFLGYWTARLFLKPIKQLIKGTQIIRSGNLDYKLEVSTRDEIQDLINNFNQLVLEWKNKQLLEKENRKLSQSVEQSPISIIITDENLTLEYINPKVSEITGYSPEEIKNSKLTVFQQGLLPFEIEHDLLNTLKDGKAWKGEIRNTKKNGDQFWEYATVSPLVDDKRKVTNFLIIKEDITDRKKMIEELIVAKNKAEVAAKLKSEFLNQMSHEIRTPLNIINGASSILEEELLTDANQELQKFFESMKAGSARIIRTIESILLISELKSGTYETTIRTLDLHQTLLPYMAMTGDKLSRQTAITFNMENITESLLVKADEHSLQQIANHLLDNAFKYTPKGEVTVNVDRADNDIFISVSDTGIGMTAEFLSDIFNPFTQEDQSINRPYEGNGLGLALIQEFCKVNNILLQVESTKNQGSIFTLTLKAVDV